MCGIAGLILSSGAPPPEPATLSKLIDSLHHRGPDGDRPAGSAARAGPRAAVDHRPGDGWQPLHAGRATLIGNGEIYNYVELRPRCPAGFATGCDFEPLLHLYARAPLRAAPARHVRDLPIGACGRTWLARDPFGIKPLYIVQLAGGLAFASEPQALLEAGLVARSEQDQLSRADQYRDGNGICRSR